MRHLYRPPRQGFPGEQLTARFRWAEPRLLAVLAIVASLALVSVAAMASMWPGVHPMYMGGTATSWWLAGVMMAAGTIAFALFVALVVVLLSRADPDAQLQR